jgi:polar amino acid transport system substrate-binding protein
MSTVNARRPLGYLCVAGVLALGSLLLPDAGPLPPAAAPAAAPPSGPATSQAPGCTETRESLRPSGPLPPPGAMPPGSTMATIAERGRLIVGVDQGKYLSGYRNPLTGGLEGADIDVARMVSEAIFGDPERVQYVVLDIADRPAAIDQHQVDLVVNHFTVTCERQQLVEFSTAYLAVTQRILVPVGSGIGEVEDLAGRRVCTSAGSTTEVTLRELPIDYEVVSLAGIPDCIVELHRGRVAAVSSDDVILAGLAAQDPQTEVVGRGLAHALYGIGVHPDAPDLVRFVNAVLERARADGSLTGSYQRWYAGVLDPLPQPPAARYRD